MKNILMFGYNWSRYIFIYIYSINILISWISFFLNTCNDGPIQERLGDFLNSIFRTSGFWPRVRARALRAPVFLGSVPRQKGRCAPPVHRSFLFIPPPKKNLIPETKCFPSGPNSGSQGRISFHRSKLHPTELHSI